jgi:hypothetical protein
MGDKKINREYPWVVCHDGADRQAPYAMECLRCGAIQRVALPISIPCYVAMGRAFERMHSRCRESRTT